jgi:type II secretory pathway predicted ATPase ExeA
MYRNFFSLSDLPFSISPAPKYLFRSDRHKEALAHLTYGLGGSGLGEHGGFALLTGEVGTGKTTISRCLMEQLPDNTQVAFILNPTLSSQELLATLCDELKIRYRKTGASLKSLTDKIAEKLLKNHKNDINTLLYSSKFATTTTTQVGQAQRCNLEKQHDGVDKEAATPCKHMPNMQHVRGGKWVTGTTNT